VTYTNAAKDAAVNAIRALLTSNIGYVSMHTADPGTTGASEATGTAYARGSSTFPAASGGTGSTGGQASVTARTGSTTAATHVGIWTAITAGTFITGIALSVTENFSTAGGTLQYTPTLTAT
jgi:hypothetical protein